MRTFRSLLLAGAALVVSGVAAHAADLYSKGVVRGGSLKDTYVSHAPAGCPSWYGRLDAGYVSYDRPSASEIGIDDYMRPTLADSWSLGGGIGRYVTCSIRTDLTVDHRFESEFKGHNGNIYSPVYGVHKFGYESTAVLLNFYYDFDMRSRFTPYIGFGFGLAHNQINGGRGVVDAEASFLNNNVRQLRNTGGNPIRIDSDDKWQVAGAVMAGFSVAMRERLKLDAGYRFLYLGEVNTGQIRDEVTNALGGPTRVEELHSHEFRIGLRYDIR